MRALFLSLLLCLSLPSFSATVKSGKFCSDDQDLCINGVIQIDSSKGLAILTGRVTKTTRPGFVRITLHGYAQDKIFKAYIQGRIKGKYSEVINLKNGATRNSDTKWVIKRFEYLPLE